MLPSTGQRILGLLSAALVFLCVMNLDIRLSWKNEVSMSQPEPAISEQETLFQSTSKPEENKLKPEGKESKPEKEFISPESEASTATFTQVNKLEECQPKTNIVFIKTFKTAGSTLSNILSRFAMKHNLTIRGHGLRELKLNYSSLGKSNIICDHISYNRTKLADIMSSDTVYVTLLRQPLAQLISRLNYRGYVNVVDPVETYKNSKYFGGSTNFYGQIWDPWRQLNIPQDVTSQQFPSFLALLENELDLVAITEQFDLSLLLLRRKLCWDISDMIYVKLKTANYNLNNNSALLNESNKHIFNQRYQIANPNAYNLYEYFNKTLSSLIYQEGSDLQQELIYFQELKRNVSNYCSKYIEMITPDSSTFSFDPPFSDVLEIPANRWGKAYTVDPVDCAMMKLHRMTFQHISTAKMFNKELLLKRLGIVTDEEMKQFYFSMTEPVHPKYGIPLPVLKHVKAYDLHEGVFHVQKLKEKAKKMNYGVTLPEFNDAHAYDSNEAILRRVFEAQMKKEKQGYPLPSFSHGHAHGLNEAMSQSVQRYFKAQGSKEKQGIPLPVLNHGHERELIEKVFPRVNRVQRNLKNTGERRENEQQVSVPNWDHNTLKDIN